MSLQRSFVLIIAALASCGVCDSKKKTGVADQTEEKNKRDGKFFLVSTTTSTLLSTTTSVLATTTTCFA